MYFEEDLVGFLVLGIHSSLGAMILFCSFGYNVNGGSNLIRFYLLSLVIYFVYKYILVYNNMT